MTICIAAVCKEGIVVAADKMVTRVLPQNIAVSYEPPITKISVITDSIVSVNASDLNWGNQIVERVRKAEGVADRSVKEVADLCCHQYGLMRIQDVEQRLLSQYGITVNDIVRSKEISDAFRNSVTIMVSSFGYVPVDTIITGIDTSGAHLYRICNSTLQYCDNESYVCIGIGAGHAESVFFAAKFSRSFTLTQTKTLVHCAKKMSEIVSGVGNETDMLVIGLDYKLAKELTLAEIKSLDTAYNHNMGKLFGIEEMSPETK